MADKKFFGLVTSIGSAEFLQAAADGTKVKIKQIAVGDGGGSYYQPTASMTVLKNECWRGDISSVTKDTSANTISADGIIPSNIGGFTIREMGLFDVDGKMIAICNAPNSEKVAVADGATNEMSVGMSIVVSNTAVIELITDPTVIVATKKDLETKADLINGVVPSEEMPIASNDTLGAVQLSVDFKLNADGSLAVNKGKIGGTGNVPIELSNGQAAAEIELPIKFNDSGEVIMTDDGTGTGIVSLQEVGNKLEFVAKNVL